MYFSNNVTYYYEPYDDEDPDSKVGFLTLEQYFGIKEDQYRKRIKEKLEFLEESKDEFSPEELEFLKKNWVYSF